MLQHRKNMLYGFAEAKAQAKYAEPNVLDNTPKYSNSRKVLKEILANTFLSLVQDTYFFFT